MFDQILERLLKLAVGITDELTPAERQLIDTELRAFLTALANARAGGAAAAGTSLRAVLEALKALLAALLRHGLLVRQAAMRIWIGNIETLLARMGGAGAGSLILIAEILLILLAVVLLVLSALEIRAMYGIAEKPIGGPPCGQSNPIAKNLQAEGYSHFGERRAFLDALENARADAQQFTCKGECGEGECRGNVAVVAPPIYKWRLFWTTCEIDYDVYCECY